ncbi:MAG TPA: ABC transporter ATP-binding protein [Pelagibacterium sp.]|uniref:ABC transporter ATP-binding protein n=1 Tax=Pelagibacterium sp. TaxID=1967288 RepID=UPI002CAA7772|nr:ABC transporter ATP-binding protein [Pelagibacterium sp.]HWJ87901.1 ABC transporter ATP-binding protein [Pelagibacterium sp.]
MTAIALAKIEKRFGGQNGILVLDKLDLTIGEGESYVLLGQSGCGKTTTLRMMAGLEEPTGGEMTISGNAVYSRADRIWVAPERRPIGMVFQSYALWPTMTVMENVRFTLERGRTRLARAEAVARTRDVLEMMQIGHLADRRVTQLSGGQQQRVALARAVAQQPRILLMDEPLSNLDPQLRSDVRGEIRRLCKNLGTTAVIVTHDRDDALGLADRVGVMDKGRILQQAAPSDVMSEPGSLFIARLFGEVNTLDGHVAALDDGHAKIAVASQVFSVKRQLWMETGQTVVLGARPLSQSFAENGIAGTVAESHLEGQMRRNKVDVGDGMMTIYHEGTALPVGERVFVATRPEGWMVFPTR